MATARQIAQTVIAMANSLGQQSGGLFIPDIANMIPQTIKELVMSVADMGVQGDRKLLQKDFTVAISGSSADLTTHLNDAAGQMYAHLPFPSVIHSSSQAGELLYKPDRQNLDFIDPSTEGYDYYAVDGNVLYFISLSPLTGNFTVRSFFFPVVTALPEQFEQDLINRLLMKIGAVKR